VGKQVPADEVQLLLLMEHLMHFVRCSYSLMKMTIFHCFEYLCIYTSTETLVFIMMYFLARHGILIGKFKGQPRPPQ